MGLKKFKSREIFDPEEAWALNNFGSRKIRVLKRFQSRKRSGTKTNGFQAPTRHPNYYTPQTFRPFFFVNQNQVQVVVDAGTLENNDKSYTDQFKLVQLGSKCSHFDNINYMQLNTIFPQTFHPATQCHFQQFWGPGPRT